MRPLKLSNQLEIATHFPLRTTDPLYSFYSVGTSLLDKVIDPLTYGLDPDVTSANDHDDIESVIVPQTLRSSSLQQLES